MARLMNTMKHGTSILELTQFNLQSDTGPFISMQKYVTARITIT